MHSRLMGQHGIVPTLLTVMFIFPDCMLMPFSHRELLPVASVRMMINGLFRVQWIKGTVLGFENRSSAIQLRGYKNAGRL